MDNETTIDHRWLVDALETMSPRVDVDAAQADLDARLAQATDRAPRRPMGPRLLAAAVVVLLGAGGFLIARANLSSESTETVSTTDDEATTDNSQPSVTPATAWQIVSTELGQPGVGIGFFPFITDIGGERLLILDLANGGNDIVGEIYDFSTGTSARIADSGQIWRSQAAVVWTGEEVLVVGGSNGPGIDDPAIAYRPDADAWRVLPPPPITELLGSGSSIWTGTELILWRHGLALDPANGTWRSISTFPGRVESSTTATFTDGEIVVYGGFIGNDEMGEPSNEGYTYQLDSDTWTALSPSPLDAGSNPAAVWTGDRVLVYAGALANPDSDRLFASYDPANDKWTALPAPGGPSRRYAALIWDDAAGVAYLWGGSTGDGELLGTGATFDASTNAWTELSPAPDGMERDRHTIAVVGDRLYVTGGGIDEPAILVLEQSE